MARTLNTFTGFETGGLEEVNSSGNAPTLDSTTKRTGTYSLQCAGKSPEAFVVFATTDSNDQLFGFAVRFSDVTPAANVEFLHVDNAALTVAHMRLRMKTDGNLVIVDANDSEVASVANPFTAGQWHTVEVRLGKGNSANCGVWVDGTSVLFVSAGDFQSGTADMTRIGLRGSPTTGEQINFDDFYSYHTVDSNTERLSNGIAALPFWEVLGPYQNTAEDGTDQGDALNDGTWALMSETPANEGTSNDGGWTGTPRSGYMITDEGTRLGPASDTRFTYGTGVASKFLHRIKRGTGGGTTHNRIYGTSASQTTEAFPTALTVGYENRETLSTAHLPTTSQSFAVGMGVSGAQDIIAADIWAFYLQTRSGSTPLSAAGAVGSIIQPASTGQVVYTGMGFRPKLILFFVNQRTSDGDTGHYGIGWGVGASSTSRISISGMAQSTGTSNADRRIDNSKAINFMDYSQTVLLAADLVSLDDDGFTLNFTTTDGSGRIISYLAFDDADITNVNILEKTSPTTAISQDYTGMGFQADALICMTIAENVAAPDSHNKIQWSIGFGIGDLTQRVVGNQIQDGQATANTKTSLKTDKIVSVPDAGGASLLLEGALTAIGSDGFTINWTTVPSAADTRRFWIIGLKTVSGKAFKIGTVVQPTSTGSQAITNVGIKPKNILFIGSHLTVAGVDTTRTTMMLGAASGPSNRFAYWTGYDEAGTDFGNMRLLTNRLLAAYLEVSGGSSTAQAAADLTSFDVNGFTNNWGAADATQRLFPYLAYGTEPILVAGNQPASTGAITKKYLISLAGAQPAPSGTLTKKPFIALSGTQPAASGAIAKKYLIALAGSQPAPSGSLSLHAAIALAGNQPASSGALTKKYLIALAGSQPASSGAISTKYLISLAGSQPAASGSLTQKYLISLAGSQPAATGSVSAQQGATEIDLAGNQPAATGALVGKYLIALAGSQPAATGALTKKYLISLAGSQPASTGALTKKYLISLAGSQPSATGTLASKYVIALAGNQPSASGSLSLHAFIALAGNQPAPSGAITKKYLVALSGSQPSATGSLSVAYRVSLSGSQPAASGTIATQAVFNVNLAGNQPTATGALTKKYIISLAGSQPAATGNESLFAQIAFAGNQPSASGALTTKYLVSLSGNQPASSGTLVAIYKISLAGAQPASTGTVSILYKISLAGSQPAASGELSSSTGTEVSLSGLQPAPSGSLSLVASIALAGNQPAPSGSLTQKYFITLAGVQPSATGVVSAQSAAAEEFTGNQPAPSGAIAILYKIGVSGSQPQGSTIGTAGAQPAASGSLTRVYAISLVGNQPAASSTLSVLYKIGVSGTQPQGSTLITAGNQPAASGSLRTSAAIALAGSQPSSVGVIAPTPIITLAGNQPASTSTLAAVVFQSSFISLAGNQPAPAGVLFAAFTFLLGVQVCVTLWGINEEKLPDPSGHIAPYELAEPSGFIAPAVENPPSSGYIKTAGGTKLWDM